jgi:hypothetical protein
LRNKIPEKDWLLIAAYYEIKEFEDIEDCLFPLTLKGVENQNFLKCAEN